MSKFVKTIAIVAVAAVIVVVAAPALAGLLTTWGVSVATAAAITAGISGMAISLGLQATLALFRKTPDMSDALVQRLQTEVGPTVPRKIIFGLTAAGADVRFQSKHDLPSTKKDGFSQVVALASHRVNAIKSWYLDEVLSWSSGSLTDGKYRDAIIMFNPVLEGTTGAGITIPNTVWNSTTNSFTGCSYYQVTFKLDFDILSDGTPSKRTTIVEGCPVYDPRMDSTNGGSGSHRPNDNTTWTYYDGSTAIGRNPALCLLTFMLGWRVNGKLMWGMGLPIYRIDLNNFAFYANLCEEAVTTKDGGSTQRYTCDGAFSTSDQHLTVINGITAAMGSCVLTDTGGIYQLVGGYDDTDGPVIDFTLDDLEGPWQWNAVPSPRDRFNEVRGRFVDPSQQYQLVDWGSITTDPLPDGYDRVMTLDLGVVSRAETAQRIAKQFLLREAKTPGIFESTFKPKAFLVEVGSLLTLSGPNEWNGKLFRVTKQTETVDMTYQMTLREESAEVYAWDHDEAKDLPTQVRPPAWDSTETLDPENLAVTSQAIASGNGNSVSYLTITWTPEYSGRVRAIQIQTKSEGQVDWSTATDYFDPKAGQFQTPSNIPGVAVNVRARYQMSTGVFGNWVSTDGESENVEVVDQSARDSAQEAIDLIAGLADDPTWDFTPPAVPTGLTLSSAAVIDDVTGQSNTILTATWDPPSDSDLVGYSVALSENSGNYVDRVTTAATYNWTVQAGVSYAVKVSAFDSHNNYSAYCNPETTTAVADTVAPAAPTGLASKNTTNSVVLSWLNPSDADLKYAEIYRNTVPDNSTATLIATVNAAPSAKGGFVDGGVTTTDTFWYWVKAVDTSGNKSDFDHGDDDTIPGNQVLGQAVKVTGDDIAVDSILADNILANVGVFPTSLSSDIISNITSLPGSIEVTDTGFTLSTLASSVGDPAATINAGTTKIGAGSILLSGSTTLADWGATGDLTKIDGGHILTNSIDTTQLRIASRPITVTGITFAVNSAGTSLSWTAGTITWQQYAGSYTSRSISSGATSTAGTNYIYWSESATTLTATTDPSVANSSSVVVMATWVRGSKIIVPTYGGTIIDGDNITTGTMNANKLQAGTITSTQLATSTLITNSAQIGDAVVTNAKIGSLAVDTLKIAGGAVTANQVVTGTDTYVAASGVSNFIVTPVMTIGDGTYGSGVINVSFSVDATLGYDSSCTCQLYTSINGAAWVLNKSKTLGMATNDGDTYARFDGSLISVVSGAQVQVYANCYSNNAINSSVTRALYVRDITCTLVGAKR